MPRNALMQAALKLFDNNGEVLQNDLPMLDIVDRIITDPDSVTYGELDDLIVSIIKTPQGRRTYRENPYWRNYIGEVA